MGIHLQLDEELWLADSGSHFRGNLGRLFPLLSKVSDALEVPLRQTQNANWLKYIALRQGVNSEAVIELGPGAHPDGSTIYLYQNRIMIG